MLISKFLFEYPSRFNGYPAILSQMSMDNNEWNSVQIFKLSNMQSLPSDYEEADICISMQALESTRAGYKQCVVISYDTEFL